MDDLIVRLRAWLIRRLGIQTLLSLGLLLTAMGSVALGLEDVIRGLDNTLVLPVAVSGVLLGWLLAGSPLAGWKAGSLAFVLGAQAILLSVGRLSQSLLELLRSLVLLAWEVLRWPLGGVPDGSSVTSVLLDLGTGVETLLIRVRDWLLAVIQGQAAFDPVAVAGVWSLAVWMATVWASWAVRRRYQALQGIAPAAVLLAISLSYTWDRPSPLWVLLAATLPLIVITQQTARERRWLSAGMDFSPEVRVDLAVATIWVSLALLAAAILVPSISVRPFTRSAHRLLAEHLSAGKQLADSMGLEPLAGPGIAFEQTRAGGLPNRSLIGAGPELSEQVMMVIRLEGQKTSKIRISTVEVPANYYWRDVTYDHYTGRGWRAGQTEMVAYQAGEPALWGASLGYSAAVETSVVHRMVRQEVQAVGDLGGLLYRTGELVTADKDFRVAWRSPNDAFGGEIEATVYKAGSLVSVASEVLLRSAGSDYPSWVQDRYLALPDEITARVLTLAQDLTAVEPTPYDKAHAIESYLRAIPYTLDLPAPPPNREVVDYFLFDLRQGFCDYYATAMVVLARAAGLPARFVTGYVSGAYNAVDALYVVSAADAHSWVDIYFPEYGWVEFEPTAGRPAIERPAEGALTDMVDSRTALEPLTGRRIGQSRRVWLGVLGALALLGLGTLAWWRADARRLWRSSPAATVTILYQRLYRHGRRLAVPAEAGDTPHEFATVLMGRVTELAGERYSNVALAAVSERVGWLTDLYVQALYSPREPNAAERAQAIQTWRWLRQRLWRAWIWQKRGGK